MDALPLQCIVASEPNRCVWGSEGSFFLWVSVRWMVCLVDKCDKAADIVTECTDHGVTPWERNSPPIPWSLLF